MFYPRCSHHLFLPPIPHLRIESLKHDSRKDAKAAKVTDRGPLFYDLSDRASKFGGIVTDLLAASRLICTILLSINAYPASSESYATIAWGSGVRRSRMISDIDL